MILSQILPKYKVDDMLSLKWGFKCTDLKSEIDKQRVQVYHNYNYLLLNYYRFVISQSLNHFLFIITQLLI